MATSHAWSPSRHGAGRQVGPAQPIRGQAMPRTAFGNEHMVRTPLGGRVILRRARPCGTEEAGLPAYKTNLRSVVWKASVALPDSCSVHRTFPTPLLTYKNARSAFAMLQIPSLQAPEKNKHQTANVQRTSPEFLSLDLCLDFSSYCPREICKAARRVFFPGFSKKPAPSRCEFSGTDGQPTPFAGFFGFTIYASPNAARVRRKLRNRHSQIRKSFVAPCPQPSPQEAVFVNPKPLFVRQVRPGGSILMVIMKL